MSGDGNSFVAGAIEEKSAATGVSTGTGGVDTGDDFAGAAYVFNYSGGAWSQTAYVKPSNTQAGGRFGWSVALSGDGSTLAVGSEGEASAATGVSTNSTDTSEPFAGAAYLFNESGSTWSQTAYVKASNTRANAIFGKSVALSGDGTTLVVGSTGESSGATGVNNASPGQGDTTANNSGAAYLFAKTGVWTQTAYVKASNTRGNAYFGYAVALSVDGKTLVVGSTSETSAATGVNNTTPGQGDTSIPTAGAAYVYTPVGGVWAQTGYLKSPFAHPDNFGYSVAATNGAATLAVGGSTDPSNATGIGGDPSNALAGGAGSVSTFE